MAIRPFLAMTAAEMRKSPGIPGEICWMACHFSPYGLGLSNLPGALPPGALLMLDDITPIHHHDREVIAAQLTQCIRQLQCAGVLLDFQRPDYPETAALAAHLTEALPCPVAVSELYARELACPVFLSAPPCHEPLDDYFAPWRGREVWLELALDGMEVTVTEDGSTFSPLPFPTASEGEFHDEPLCCHYRIIPGDGEIKFLLRRTEEDLEALLKQAEQYGVTTAVGLYQELMPPSIQNACHPEQAKCVEGAAHFRHP